MILQPQIRFAAAASRIQARVDAELAQESAPGPDGTTLQPHMESLFEPVGPEAKGTVVMFHGYTAGPWQYRHLAEKFHDAGYNVYAPRMPGHGVVDANGVPTGAKIPNHLDWNEWTRFVDRSYEEAASLGAPVFAVGLSGGGNVALKMGERHPDLQGVAAMAPYLGADLPHGLPFLAADLANRLTLGLAGYLLDLIPFHHNKTEAQGETPHTQGSLGQANMMRRLGADIHEVRCPVQIVSTDGDKLSGQRRDARMFERCGGEARSGWYRFHAEEQVPHAMVCASENPQGWAVDKVEEILFDFVEKGQRCQRHS